MSGAWPPGGGGEGMLKFRFDGRMTKMFTVKNRAVSGGSSEGYFIPSLLTTATFLLAFNKA